MKAYANGKGISIIGDLPIYVSPDSAEVWARPELFQLKEGMTPAGVAGVPPDAFSDKGQHWGNPLYDWDYHRKTGFAWWRSRAVHLARLYDVVRIDHFRGFHTYCASPTAEDARRGTGKRAPGMELVEVLRAVPGAGADRRGSGGSGRKRPPLHRGERPARHEGAGLRL